MSLVNLAEEVVETAVPETRLVKPILYLIAGWLAIGAIALLWWLVFGRAHVAEVKAATAKVEAATSTATAGAAQQTLHIVTDNARTIAAIDALSRENTHAIETAPGASVSVDPALDRAGRAALCMRTAYSADPGCAALRPNGGSVGAAAADPGSSAPR